MISSLDPSALSFLRGLNQIQQRSQQAQRELTTGLRVNTVSDAPDQIAILWQTRADINEVQQIQSNLSRVKPEVDTAETAVSSSVSLLERAQTLGAEGATGTATADTRQSLASELGALLQQLVANSNTSVEGRYIFSGDADQQAPYSIDLTQANPISPYQGAAGTRQIQHPDGSLFTVSKTAQEIFDNPDPSKSVFGSINNLRIALLKNDQTAIQSAMADVGTAGTYLNTQLSFYGTVQDQMAGAIDYGQNNLTQLKTQLSGIQDADEAQSITELQLSATQQQAALVSRSQLPKTSLFDYLG